MPAGRVSSGDGALLSHTYSDRQLDAIRELGNVGSGTAATALSSMIGVPVDIDIARASAVALADCVTACGPPDTTMTAVVLPIFGELQAVVMILMSAATVATLCELLGVPMDDEMSDSALREIGNILGASYVRALGQMIGAELEPRPPELVHDMLDGLLSGALGSHDQRDIGLLLESTLSIDDRECSPSFLFMPSAGGLSDIFSRLGLDR